MKSKEVVELIKTIAKDLKLDSKIVEAVALSQFEATRRKIVTTERKEDLVNFRYPYLGLFVAKRQTLNKKYRTSKK